MRRTISRSATASRSGLSPLIAVHRSPSRAASERSSARSSRRAEASTQAPRGHVASARRSRSLAARGAFDQPVHLLGILAVVTRGGLQLLDWDLRGGSDLPSTEPPFWRIVVIASATSRREPSSAGRRLGRPLAEMDQRVLILANALLDIALGKRRRPDPVSAAWSLRRRTVIGSKRKLTLCLAELGDHRATSVSSCIAQ